MAQVERPIPRRVRDCFLILAVYGVSFALPVRGMDVLGQQAFATGRLLSDRPLAIQAVGAVAASPELLVPCLAWLANPLLWVGLCLIESGHRTAAVVVAGLAVAFASQAIDLVWGSICPGYAAWTASMVMLLAAALSMPRDRRAAVGKPPAIDPDI
jgi:hypothetical protein